jgi:hypothetical protein
MNERLIIVEVGRFDNRTPSYQLFERCTNGTWRLAKHLPENNPMYFRDARRRMAEMSKVKAYGDSSEDEEEE